MKKICMLTLLMAVVSNGFAYGDYSYPELAMPRWIELMGILMIIWGVLEIILFFKIWRMTNDVHRLTYHFFRKANTDINASSVAPSHIQARLDKSEIGKYDHRLDDVKIGDKVRRASDGKILEVVGIGEKTLECRGGVLDGVHSYLKDSLSVV